MSLPEEGKSREEVSTQLLAFKENDLSWRNGRVFAGVF